MDGLQSQAGCREHVPYVSHRASRISGEHTPPERMDMRFGGVFGMRGRFVTGVWVVLLARFYIDSDCVWAFG